MKYQAEKSCDQCVHKRDSLFCDLDTKSIEKIDQHKARHLYKKGEVIFHQGMRPSGLFCLKNGKVKIFKTGIDGKEQIVRLAKPGDFIGYRSLITEEIYSGSAAAIEESEICMIDKGIFLDLIHQNSEFNWKIIQQFGHDLRQAEDFMTNLAQNSVRERVAQVLLILQTKFGYESEDSKFISMVLSRDELASFVGTATETLIRLLSDLKSEGVIDTKGQKIKIINYQNLVQIANLQT